MYFGGTVLDRHGGGDYRLDFALASLTLPRVTSPFRDELDTLRRENDRLRAELARASFRVRLSGLPLPAFMLVGVDVIAAMFLRPWLNAASDARFWGAIFILATITLAAGATAVGYKRRVV